MTIALEQHVARALREGSAELTARWVAVLIERLEVDAERALPEESILNRIPSVLQQVADHVADPEGTFLSELVREDLTRLADLRRSQNTTLGEILDEFRLLSDMIDDLVVQAVEEYEGDIPHAEVVRVVSRIKKAVYRLGTETAERYRTWDARRSRDRILLLEAYTDTLSHELANRLGAAETAVRLILGSGISLSEDRIKRLNELILSSIKSGIETVQSVRALVGSQNGEVAGESRTLPMSTLIRDAVHQMRVSAADRGIEIRLASPGPDTPVDAERFPLAFFNLVTNAVRHHDTPEGSGEVVVDVFESEDSFTVTVEDDGPGIPPELRDTVFLPQVQGSEGRGTGLGLAIARDAIQQMGGEIDFQPRGERGTLFRVHIPRPRLADQEAPEARAERAPAER